MNAPSSSNQTDQWKAVMFLYDSALKEINTKIEILNNEFVHIYSYTPIEHIKSRLKTPESIVKKLKHDGREVNIDNMIEHLSDIAGIRIICSFTSDIYQIADMILKQSDVRLLYVKDYIKNPKPNGYKSYHMVVTIPVYVSEGPVETKVEIQIRTVAMDFWASLEHKIYYKFEGHAPDFLERELKACADMVDMLDAKMFLLNEAIAKIGEEQARGDGPEPSGQRAGGRAGCEPSGQRAGDGAGCEPSDRRTSDRAGCEARRELERQSDAEAHGATTRNLEQELTEEEREGRT